MKSCRFIGDVHQKMERYIEIASQNEYSVQVGDLGFNYSRMSELDPIKHRVLGGNHDNYTEWTTPNKFILQTPHFLGDFGTHSIPDFGSFFFLRGGYSIDYMYRTPGLDWWAKEELSPKQMDEAFLAYCEAKPNILISHEGPASLISRISKKTHFDGVELKPSRTANLLQRMIDSHLPELHIFGHLHNDKIIMKDKTSFICLNELSYIDIFAENNKISHIYYNNKDNQND